MLADRIRNALREKGYKPAFLAPTNQIFIELTKERSAALSEAVEMSFWENIDDSHVVMRIVTSWATTSDDVDALIEAL